MKETQTSKILELLEHEKLSISELQHKTGIKRPNIRGRLSELRKHGFVSKTEDEKFALVIKPTEQTA